MLVPVFELLPGMGLSASAGLNAWIPLVAVGLLSRYTHLSALPPSWHWLSNGWTLAILAVLLLIEMVADKIPIMDHLNDVVHTVIRPTAGGMAFGASSQSQTVTVRSEEHTSELQSPCNLVCRLLLEKKKKKKKRTSLLAHHDSHITLS